MSPTQYAETPSLTFWGTGSLLGEFLYVHDLGEGCVFAPENWRLMQDEFTLPNVGTGHDLSIRVFAYPMAEAIGYRGEISLESIKPDGTPKKQLDATRSVNMGWQARIPNKVFKDRVKVFRKVFPQQLVCIK